MHLPFLRPLAVLAAIAGFEAAAGPAAAHAVIVEATPAVNATVHGGQLEVTLRFNSRIDRSRSRLTLIDAAGKETVAALEKSSPSDVLAASIGGLVPGKYRLRWQVLAIDGHITRGDIPFTVAAP
jgi:methionine-rich copper-binding protein CopC